MPFLKNKVNKVFFLCLTGFCAQATYAGSQPKFTIVPTTATSIEVFSTSTATVRYRITNETKVTRTLTMVPISSISQTNSGASSCANPFTLSSKQSCLLTLSINGKQLPVKGIHSGPVVCKTKGSNDNSPDPLLCSQPSASASLNVVKKAALAMVTAGFYTSTDTKLYPLLANSSDGGASWNYTIDSKTPPPGPINEGGFVSANCSGQTCVVGGAYQIGSTIYPLLAKSNNGGSSWSYSIDNRTSTLPPSYNDFGNLRSVNCSGQICVAAGSYQDTSYREYPLLARSGNNGANWNYAIDNRPTTLPPDYDFLGGFFSTSCSGQNCVAAGAYLPLNGGLYPLLARSGNGGINWNYAIDSRPATLPSDINGIGIFNSVNCSGQTCVAAGSYVASDKLYPLVARSGNGGTTWSYTINSTTTPPSGFNGNGNFNSVQCSGQICVAAGGYEGANNIFYPLLARSGNGGVSWNYVINKATIPPGFYNDGTFLSANCNGQICVTVGYYRDTNNVLYPLLARSGNGGISWNYAIDKTATLPPSFQDNGVFTRADCNGTICVAAGVYDAGGFDSPLLVRSTDGGVSWSYVIDSRPSTWPSDLQNGAFSAVSASPLSSLLPNSLSFLNHSFIHQHQGVLNRHY